MEAENQKGLVTAEIILMIIGLTNKEGHVMRKFITIIPTFALAMCLLSCSKDNPVPGSSDTRASSVINAVAGTAFTKAGLGEPGTDGYPTIWSKDDKLFIFNPDTWYAEYTLDDDYSGNTDGTFTWKDGDCFNAFNSKYSKPLLNPGCEYLALFPSDFGTWNDDTEEISAIWPTVQTYSTTDLYIPMAAAEEVADDGSLNFKFNNLGGLLRINVKGNAKIKSITIKADEGMSGALESIEINENNSGDYLFVAYMGDPDTDTKNYIRLDCGNGVDISENGKDFFISIPCNYVIDEATDELELYGYNKVSITIMNTDGETCVKELDPAMSLIVERSKITTIELDNLVFNHQGVQLWADGPYWATTNIGAEKPTDYGEYFSWGNVVGYSQSNGNFRYSFDPDNYNTSSGASLTGNIESVSNDAALSNWGGTWRLPSKDEYATLFNNTDHEYVSNYNGSGINGALFTSKSDNTKSIFFPAAGRSDWTSLSFGNVNAMYWSSSYYSGSSAYCMLLSSGAGQADYHFDRYIAFPIRPISD